MAESPTHSIKREREHDNSDYADHNDRDFGMPPAKKDSQALLHALQLQSQQLHSIYNNNSRRGASSPSMNKHNLSDDSDQHHNHSRKNHHLDQRLSSPIRNGSDKSPTTSTDLMSSGSPVALLSGMQFKLSSRGKFHTKTKCILTI